MSNKHFLFLFVLGKHFQLHNYVSLTLGPAYHFDMGIKSILGKYFRSTQFQTGNPFFRSISFSQINKDHAHLKPSSIRD